MNVFGTTMLLGIGAAVLALLLREVGFRGAMLFSSLAILLLMSIAVAGVGEMFESVLGLASDDITTKVFKEAARVVGVGYCFGISADVCKNLGESGISSAIEVVGRVEILAISLPYVLEVVKLVSEAVRA